MATKTPADYKAPHTTGYTCQKLGFDNRRPFNMGLKSQQTAESPFKVKFEPHMMYKDSEEVMANTYEKHLELKDKGYGHTKPKSPAKFIRTGGTRHGKKSKLTNAIQKGTQKVIEHGFTKLFNQAKGVKKVYDYLKGTPKGSAATGLTKKKSPAKQKVDEATRKRNLAAQIKKRKEEAGEGFMTAPYRGPKDKGPRADRKDLSYHGYTNFKSNVTGKKVFKDGVPEKLGNPAKSDAQKRVIAEKKKFNSMTTAQKKAAQDKANAKRKAFENSPEYKKRKEKQMSKN